MVRIIQQRNWHVSKLISKLMAVTFCIAVKCTSQENVGNTCAVVQGGFTLYTDQGNANLERQVIQKKQLLKVWMRVASMMYTMMLLESLMSFFCLLPTPLGLEQLEFPITIMSAHKVWFDQTFHCSQHSDGCSHWVSLQAGEEVELQ